MPDRMLPLSSKLGFGVGQVAEGVKTSALGTFALFYYNQILDVPATTVGFALSIAICVDAVTDPLAGALSDRTNSRWGRRHPWIASAALPLAGALLFLFNPPPDQSQGFYFLWLATAAVLVNLCLTLYHVPHLALGAEMATSYEDRTNIFSYSTLFGAMGGYAFYFFVLTVFFATPASGGHGMYNAAGYPWMALTAALVVLASIGLCVVGTAREIPHLRARLAGHASAAGANLFKDIANVFRNPHYLRLFVGLTIGTMVVAIESNFNKYMGIHFWGLPTEQLRWLGLAVVCGIPCSFFLAGPLARYLDKRGALICSVIAAVIIGNTLVTLRLFTNVLPENGDPLIFYLILSTAFLGGAIAPVILILIDSMFADIAEDQAHRTGQRQEGVIYSARSLSLKLTGAAGVFFAGVALDLIQFPSNAEFGAVDADVIFKLGLVAGPITSTFALASLVIYWGYRLNRDTIGANSPGLRANQPPTDIS